MGEKILLVEDDYEYNEFLYQRLKGEGYDVDTVYTSVEALEHLVVNDYALMITDLHLRILNGIKLINSARKMKPNLKTIIITGDPSDETELESLNFMADAYITKDKNMKIILKYVKAILMRNNVNGSSEERILSSRHDGITLDCRRHTVTKEGEIIPLTPIEFKLLEHFLSNKTLLLSRIDLARAVWGEEANEIDNLRLIDTHIKNLRDKIRTYSIMTVRGKGYRWND